MNDVAGPSRDGWRWWREQMNAPLPLDWSPSATPISVDAFDLIVQAEVGGHARYVAKHSMPWWPGGRAGITVGIGYDVGYSRSAHLTSDWRPRIEEMWIHRLEGKIGVTGHRAEAALVDLNKRIFMEISWQDAIWVHRFRVLPRLVGMVERSLGNSWRLGSDCLGSLVSLAWHRGVTFADPHDRHADMRSIGRQMSNGNFEAIPDEIAAMAKTWADDHPQAALRKEEAKLFTRGLCKILK
ncbi:hypothetical protein GGQ99_002353 [Aminobacter niigataensis]|uniref:Uncharacterized protein n=1 Tax=Aminobacter niigataensis TaxID=83265 RepID=A0ABR6L1B4_9HYPH|nr:hypothetical protein [Aminobacter niigataensis]MBB4650598.1 hypothetical protein [Aminobacter niigataensis]